MVENVKVPVEFEVDTSKLDRVADQFSKQWEQAGLPGPSQTKMEESIRKKSLKDIEKLNKEHQKSTSLYKEWRKGLTGVLIDLHWMRILGSQSRVLGTTFDLLGKTLGYLLDVILLPVLPALLLVIKQIMGIAKWVGGLPKAFRIVLGYFAALAIGLTTLATGVAYAASALVRFSTMLDAITAKETAKNAAGQTTLSAFGAGGGAAALKLKSGMFFAPEMFPAMKKYGGGTGEYSHDPRERIKQIGEMFGLKGFQSGGIVTSPTIATLGENGAEAVLPLDQIGSAISGLLGGGASFVGSAFQNLFSQAATGGGGVGGGLNVGGSTQSLLVKGFSWVANSVNSGFKTSNNLVAAILAMMTGGAGRGGAEPKSVWEFIDVVTNVPKSIWDFIITPVKAFWTDFVIAPTKEFWNDIVTYTTKNVWNDFIVGSAKNLWTDFITGEPRSIWDYLIVTVKEIVVGTGAGTTTTAGTSGGVGTGTATSGATNRKLMSLQKVFDSNGNYIGDWEIYNDGSKKWRPGPHSGYTGTSAPPAGSTSPAPEKEESYSTYITEGADNYAQTINIALNQGAETASNAVEESTATFADVFINTMVGVGSALFNEVSDVVGTLVEGAISVGSNIATGLNSANAWFQNTFGGLNTQLGLPPVVPASPIPFLQGGGTIQSSGLAYLHAGETVVPAQTNGGSGGITINNPTFQISGRTDREMFESFMRLMKVEGARVH